jgi:hypothetical protein
MYIDFTLRGYFFVIPFYLQPVLAGGVISVRDQVYPKSIVRLQGLGKSKKNKAIPITGRGGL